MVTAVYFGIISKIQATIRNSDMILFPPPENKIHTSWASGLPIFLALDHCHIVSLSLYQETLYEREDLLHRALLEKMVQQRL